LWRLTSFDNVFVGFGKQKGAHVELVPYSVACFGIASKERGVGKNVLIRNALVGPSSLEGREGVVSESAKSEDERDTHVFIAEDLGHWR
jgi:hypothetical protein